MVRRRKRRAGVLNPRDSQAKVERADLSALEPLGDKRLHLGGRRDSSHGTRSVSQKLFTEAITCSISASVSSGKIGRLITVRAASSAAGMLPGLWPSDA
jgi:hypothetical protein